VNVWDIPWSDFDVTANSTARTATFFKDTSIVLLRGRAAFGFGLNIL
jgi:hypothetical protein